MKFRKYRLKKKKIIVKSRFFWPVILIILAVSVVFYLLTLFPVFQIKEVSIFGQENILRQQIEQWALPAISKKILFFESKSIFLIKTTAIKNMLLQKFPAIEELKIRRLWSNAITIEVKERKAIAIWCRQENCFDLDQKGVVFGPANAAATTSQKLKINSEQFQGEIVLGKAVIDGKILEQILLVRKITEEKTKIQIIEFTLFEEEGRLNAKTAENWQAYFNLKGNLNWQILELELVLEKNLPLEKRKGLEYIDLRFSKVVYK